MENEHGPAEMRPPWEHIREEVFERCKDGDTLNMLVARSGLTAAYWLGLLAGVRPITKGGARGLHLAFGGSEQSYRNLQADYDEWRKTHD